MTRRRGRPDAVLGRCTVGWRRDRSERPLRSYMFMYQFSSLNMCWEVRRVVVGRIFSEEVLFRRVRRSEGHVQFHHVSLFLSFSSPTFTLLSR